MEAALATPVRPLCVPEANPMHWTPRDTAHIRGEHDAEPDAICKACNDERKAALQRQWAFAYQLDSSMLRNPSGPVFALRPSIDAKALLRLKAAARRLLKTM